MFDSMDRTRSELERYLLDLIEQNARLAQVLGFDAAAAHVREAGIMIATDVAEETADDAFGAEPGRPA